METSSFDGAGCFCYLFRNIMSAPKPEKRKLAPDPSAVLDGMELLREFKPLLDIIVRQDLSEEDRGRLIHQRFPPEVLRPLMERIQAVRAVFPPGGEKK